MKTFLAIFLSVALASCFVSADDDKYERMLMKWGKMKALEGCFGVENSKMWMHKMKAAKAKCSGMPAPELMLPMFQGKDRMANALTQASHSSKRNDFVDNLMRNAFIKKMMRREIIQLMGDEDDIDMPFLAKLSSRFTRDADDEDLEDSEDNHTIDVAGKMVEKLKSMEAHINSDIGNMTCVLQECGVLNDDMEIDIEKMDEYSNEMKWTAEETGDGVDRTWLQARSKQFHIMCKDLSDAVPDSILNSCEMPHYITRIIYFKKCNMFHKFEACMMSDVMNKVSDHGMSIEEIADKAGKKPETAAGLLAASWFGGKH